MDAAIPQTYAEASGAFSLGKEPRRIRRARARSKREAAWDGKVRAVSNMLRVSPTKLNLIASLIRGKPVSTALSDLEFLRKRAAVDVRKCLQSAVANAENNHELDVDRLVVAEAHVGGKLRMKRFQARGRGRSGAVVKQFSSLTVIVCEQELEPTRTSARSSKKSEVGRLPGTEIVKAVKGLRAAMGRRSGNDRSLVQVRALAKSAASSIEKSVGDYASLAARSVLPVLVAGTDEEKQACFDLLEAARREVKSFPGIPALFEAARIPCVTEIVADRKEWEKSPLGPVRLKVGVTRRIRTGLVFGKGVTGTELSEIKTGGEDLNFLVRVGAPGAKIGPKTEASVVLSRKPFSEYVDFSITPLEPGDLPVTVDFLLGRNRFTRRTLRFTMG